MTLLAILLLVKVMQTQLSTGSPLGTDRMSRGNVCFDESAVIGPCEGLINKWTYKDGLGCFLFPYGGCGGNANNFDTRLECEKLCQYYV